MFPHKGHIVVPDAARFVADVAAAARAHNVVAQTLWICGVANDSTVDVDQRFILRRRTRDIEGVNEGPEYD